MRARSISWICALPLLLFLACGKEREFAPDDSGQGGDAGSASGGTGDGGSPNQAGGTGGDAGSGNGSGGDDDTASGGHTDDGTGGDPGIPPQLGCTEAQLLNVGSEVFAGTTTGSGDDFDASCFSGAGDDLAIEWIAPADDYYRFTTAGSTYDTALALIEEQCAGSELACNADPSTPQVEIVHFVAEDERVVVILDGKLGAAGDVVLSVEPVACPGLDLSDQGFPVELSTQNQGDNSAACDGAGTNDRALRFTPSSDGLYRFSATSADFGAIVSVETGPICGGPALGCGFSSRSGEPGELVRQLSEGEPVTVFVDGGSGTFELDIEDISALASCPSEASGILLDGAMPPVEGSLEDAVHLLTGSCAPTGDFDPLASFAPLVERSFPVSVDLGEDLSCALNVTSPAPFAAYLLQGGQCAGPELECVVEAAAGSHAFSFDNADNGDYVLVVEDLQGFGDTFEIYVTCII